MITPIPNQPIHFPNTGENSLAQEIAARCDIPQFDFCQISRADDEVNFQVAVDPTDTLGWAIREKGGDFLFVDSSEGHVTYNLTHTVAWVTFHWDDILTTDCFDKCLEIYIFKVGECDIVIGTPVGNHISNGTFDDNSFWTTTAGFTIGGGVATIDSSSSPAILTTPGLSLVENCFYKLTFDIVNYQGGGLRVFITGGGAQELFPEIKCNGKFEIIFKRTSALSHALRFRDPVASTGNDVLSIDNVVLEEVFQVSEPINVQTSFNECTLLMRWTNLEDAFGFEYTSFPSAYAEFSHVLRIEANLWHAIYPKDKKLFTNSSQVSKILYSNTSKRFEIETFLLPEYLHDALSIGLEHDSFEIQDETKSKDFVTYVALEEDYEPVWEEDMILGRVTFGVIKGTPVKRENRNC